MSILTLNGIKSGAFDTANQTTNFHTSQTVQYESGDHLCVQFEKLPDSYKYKRIISITANCYVVATVYSNSTRTRIYFGPIDKVIDPETITYTNGGSMLNAYARVNVERSSLPSYAAYTFIMDRSGSDKESRFFLNNGAVIDAGVDSILATTRHTRKPQLKVEFDDANVTLNFTDTNYLGWGAGTETKISWLALPSSTVTYTAVKQQSAKVQWKRKTESSIHDIDIAATQPDENSSSYILVPPGVLPAGDIMWRVIATANNGETVTSEWFEHKVYGVAIKSASPASGYVAKTKPNVFTWMLSQIKNDYGDSYTRLPQKTATFRWRASSNSAIHTIQCGETPSVTVPAGTFTTNTIQWQVTAAIAEGVSATSEWMELSTVEVLSSAEAVTPNGEVVDNASPTVFKWSHIISTGTAQTKAELQLSTDKQVWSALATVTGAERTYTAPPNTLGSGTKYWRVRTYNTDNAAGAWSEPAEFICVGAPAAPIVSIRAQTPRPTVGWQSAEQLAYQVELAGHPVSSVYYGTEKTWTSPTYLPDGAYTVRVRVQNEYGLWSPWGEAALQVVNVPGAAISLTIDADDAARLAWQTTGSYDFFLIYRDGRLIGRTTERSFTDSASVGAVRYQVRGCYSSSANYGLSPEVAATIAVQYITLSDMDTGAILPLPYSESAHRTTSRTRKQQIQAVQLAGRAYPVIERSEHMAQSISVACAFYTQEDCAALEEMLGHLVTVRTPEGRMVTGCLAQLTERTDGGFYSVYTFSVDQADWEEAIRIDA